MFRCPHCGKAIEDGEQGNVPWWQYNQGSARVSLGCGTLILIAIIVAIFSRGNDKAIEALRTDIQALERKIDQLQFKPFADPLPIP
jgi:hypothetical protein